MRQMRSATQACLVRCPTNRVNRIVLEQQDGVGNVWIVLFLHDEFFPRGAGSNGRLFDSSGCIFENRQAVLGRGENGGTASRPKQNRGFVTLHINDGFERAAIWLMLANQLRQPIANRDQASRRLQRTGVMDRAKEERARFSILAVNNRDSAVTQRSINRQDAHGSMLNKAERKENAASSADNQAYQPIASPFR